MTDPMVFSNISFGSWRLRLLAEFIIEQNFFIIAQARSKSALRFQSTGIQVSDSWLSDDSTAKAPAHNGS
jgi:hypothetical protein